MEETRQVLKALAEEPNIRELDAKSCSDLFKAGLFKKTFPFYTDLGVIDSSGKLVCSVIQDSGLKDFADQVYFNETLTSTGFSMGLFQKNFLSGAAEIGFGYPILDSEGKLKGVVFAILDMGIFDMLAKQETIPPNASLTVIDSTGTVMARYPEATQWIGQSGSSSEIVNEILRQKEGVREAVGIDGVKKIYGFKQLGSFSRSPFV